ncbi:uncharacterized protein LOC135480256 isoform X2 [Liolophura sinensis]
MEEIMDEQGDRRRKSSRRRMKRRPFSPDKTGQDRVKTRTGVPCTTKRKRKAGKPQPEAAHDRPCDRLANGTPFCCDLCKSPHVCNRSNKPGKSSKPTKYTPSPRHKVDPLTGRMLRLCNACGLAFDRSDRPRKARVLPPPEDKEKYLDEAKQFGQRLSVELNDPDAERLYCPQFKFKACGCLQSYILFEGDQEHSSQRAEKLLKLVKEAKQLRTLKYYSQDEVKKPQRSRNIGLGNGMKKSKLFEEFVMEKRHYLKETLKLCERAVQKILIYSNNFIHKKLKSEDSNCRARRVIGKAALGLLPPLSELDKKKCCIDKCVMVAVTHSRLLQEWRDRATQGQAEARRVLAEMLTPSGGARSNCYKFISMVTGCSPSLIGCVNDQMRRTGGDRKPPTHGMKKFWQVNQRRAKDTTIADGEQGGGTSVSCNNANSSSCTLSTAETSLNPNDDNGTVDNSASSTSYQFEVQRQQLLQLQRQLTEQQNQIQQHQQLVQQQLLQQTLLQQLTESGSCTQMIQTQPASTVSVPVSSTTGPGLSSGVQPLIISTNHLPGLDTSPTVPILQPSLQTPFNAQATPQQAATLLPAQQFTQPQTTIMAAPTIPQQPQLQQHQQQPVQTVQVMIANIELPIQQGQTAVQLIVPSQQQAQQNVMLHTQQQNTLLQQQQPTHILQQQHGHITPQQQQPPRIMQQGSFITKQQQQPRDALSSQTLTLPVHLRPPVDHTYSQSQPPTSQGSVRQQSLSITQPPFQYQVVQGQPCSVEASQMSPVASVSMSTPGSNSGFSVLPQPTQSSSSPLQMLASFTSEPTLDSGQTLRPSQGSWPSEALTPCAATTSVSPSRGLNPNPVQAQTLSLAAPALNLQSALHQIFSIVSMNGASALGSGSMAGDTGSPVASPTKPEPSPALHLGMTAPSSQPCISLPTETSSSPSSSSVDRELSCNMFMQQEQVLPNSACLTQSDHQVAAGVGELQQNSPETQESPSGEVTSSPLSSDMMNLLSENCE